MTSKSREGWIGTERGRLYARRWEPTEDTGARAPILLFHESLGSVAQWREFPDYLAKETQREVIAYDRLGFGRSDARTEPMESDLMASEANVYFPKLRAHFEFEKCVCFGHSIGGAISVFCAGAFPESCVAVISESTQVLGEARSWEGIAAARALFRDPIQFSRIEKYHGAKARWVLDAWVNTWDKPEFRNFSLAEPLQKVRCPTLIIHGDRDEFGTIAQPQAMARHISAETRLEILSDVGHVPHRERPMEVATLVRDFLSNLA